MTSLIVSFQPLWSCNSWAMNMCATVSARYKVPCLAADMASHAAVHQPVRNGLDVDVAVRPEDEVGPMVEGYHHEGWERQCAQARWSTLHNTGVDGKKGLFQVLRTPLLAMRVASTRTRCFQRP